MQTTLGQNWMTKLIALFICPYTNHSEKQVLIFLKCGCKYSMHVVDKLAWGNLIARLIVDDTSRTKKESLYWMKELQPKFWGLSKKPCGAQYKSC